MLVIDNDNYYLTIGRDAASTIESIDVNEQVAEWIKDMESYTDEECRSIVSYNITNEEMLNYVYGHTKACKSGMHRILSDPVLIYRANNDNRKVTNAMASVSEEDYYVLEEFLHTNSHQILPGNKMSTSIQETLSIHGSSLLSQNELGPYVDYHAALSDTVTTDSDYDNPLKDLNAISTKLSTDSDTYSLSPKKCIQIIDHDIASSHDSACEMVYVPTLINHPTLVMTVLFMIFPLHKPQPLLEHISHLVLLVDMMMLL